MARAVGKSFKVDVALPTDIYNMVAQMAIDSDAPIHHKSGQRIITPSILKLLRIGIQSVSNNPDLADTDILTLSNTPDPRISELLDRVRILEDKPVNGDLTHWDELKTEVNYLRECLTSTATKDYVERALQSVHVAIESLQSQLADDLGKASIEPKANTPKPAHTSAPGEGIPMGEFGRMFNIPGLTRKVSVDTVKSLLVDHGLDGQWEYQAKRNKFYPIGEGETTTDT
jgi:hypothetical protein